MRPSLTLISGCIDAGNSSGIVDGAAAVLIGNKEAGYPHGEDRGMVR
ncbi:MAG: hypothetical protein JOZ89_07775 [Gammaproteobacteria bacterium]|nr:hypothetical protein [Gammaproteobacteria bacterium]